MNEPRTILLRRPPVCAVVDEPFMPDIDVDAVEQRWTQLQTECPAFFDGRILHVLGVHRNGHGGATINLVECAFRFHAVQDEGFDCGVRPLGVKAITTCGDRVLLGRRADWVHRYPRQWEFAPGGGVEPGSSPEDVLLRELDEETGCSAAGPPVAVALVLDEAARTWELIYRLEVKTEVLTPSTDEYSEFRWCSIEALPAPRSTITEWMRGLLAK